MSWFGAAGKNQFGALGTLATRDKKPALLDSPAPARQRQPTPAAPPQPDPGPSALLAGQTALGAALSAAAKQRKKAQGTLMTAKPIKGPTLTGGPRTLLGY